MHAIHIIQYWPVTYMYILYIKDYTINHINITQDTYNGISNPMDSNPSVFKSKNRSFLNI